MRLVTFCFALTLALSKPSHLVCSRCFAHQRVHRDRARHLDQTYPTQPRPTLGTEFHQLIACTPPAAACVRNLGQHLNRKNATDPT